MPHNTIKLSQAILYQNPPKLDKDIPQIKPEYIRKNNDLLHLPTEQFTCSSITFLNNYKLHDPTEYAMLTLYNLYKVDLKIFNDVDINITNDIVYNKTLTLAKQHFMFLHSSSDYDMTSVFRNVVKYGLPIDKNKFKTIIIGWLDVHDFGFVKDVLENAGGLYCVIKLLKNDLEKTTKDIIESNDDDRFSKSVGFSEILILNKVVLNEKTYLNILIYGICITVSEIWLSYRLCIAYCIIFKERLTDTIIDFWTPEGWLAFSEENIEYSKKIMLEDD